MIVGEAARATGLPAKTLRYYEEIGLIAPKRESNGYRFYDETDVEKLRFLQRSRSLGFSIEDCRTLLSLYEDRNRSSADVKAVAKAHLDTIERKIKELKTLHATLKRLVNCCQGDSRPDCPILDELTNSKQSASKLS